MAETRARVLVADDDPAILRLIEVTFALEGLEVVGVARGEEALRAARNETFDLIVLDVMMPGIDGWEVCERLKADEATADVPIVFLSARTRDEDQARGLGLGVDAYVTKPFDPDALLELAKRLVGRAGG